MCSICSHDEGFELCDQVQAEESQYSYLHILKQFVLCLFDPLCEQHEVNFFYGIHFLKVGVTKQILTRKEPQIPTSEVSSCKFHL